MKPYDNTVVHEFLSGYIHVSEAREDYEWIDDIFSGVLELKTEGDTSTRSLSRNKLFTYLTNVKSLSVATFSEMYPYHGKSTCYAYVALARVVAKAIQRKLDTMPAQSEQNPLPGLAESRRLLDQPYHDVMRPYGLVWPFEATKQWERPTDYVDTSEWDASCLSLTPEYCKERTEWLMANMHLHG